MNPDSLIPFRVRDLAAYVPGEQINRPGVIKLNTNENPYPPSPTVAEALAQVSGDALRLYPDPLAREVCGILADLHGVKPGQILAGNGSDEVLALCTRAFVQPGQGIGYLDPSYSLYPVLTAIHGARMTPVPLNQAFQWEPGPAPANCPLFFITNPNAPTGMLHDREVVAAFCRSYQGVVVIDEAYVDFATDTCLDLARTLPNVLVTRTLSKSYALAGIRFGYAVGNSELIGALYKLKDSYNLNLLTQKAAAAALRDQAWMKNLVERIRATREAFVGELVRLGFSTFPSETNFVWTRPPSHLSAPDLYQALKRQDILIRHFSPPGLREHVRISIGTDEQMATLARALQNLCA